MNVPPPKEEEVGTESMPDLRESPLARLREDPDGTTEEVVRRTLGTMERKTQIPIATFNSFI